ncbi:MAG: hypothetical protein AMXMBFR53_25310 [Gemmatimonadota bacterium]
MSTQAAPAVRTFTPAQAMAFPAAFAAALLVAAQLFTRGHPVLYASTVGAALVAAVWMGVLFATARGSRRTLTWSFVAKRQHWVQVIAQLVVYAWWGWHVRVVYAFIPLLVTQLLFAYAVDALLNWSRRDHWAMSFGPMPVILSINLFLWFQADWFYWQYAMILVGFLAKDLIRWQKEGRSAHIFNPSSFPLAVGSIILIATAAPNVTFGEFIANSQHDPPHIYLILLLAALPGQFLFGVARMTLASVATMMAISLVYFQVTGTYFFFDSHIPVPVFLGMHLLFTDPSTSPRTELGRILFGMTYSVATAALFVLLPLVGAPTFYDKLLPVPFMNLMVRRFDAWAQARPLSALDPARIGAALTQPQRNFVYASAWTVLFAVLYATQGVGDRHPGQYLPFWQEACAEGSERACRYRSYLTFVYCQNGSGWACNEYGALEMEERRTPGRAFERACELGYQPGCANAQGRPEVASLVRGDPAVADLPIVLRGTKPALTERDPAVLRDLGCRQGWPGMCG